MEEHNHPKNNNGEESHFYKGLFFGVLLGIGLIWFLKGEKGRELVQRFKERLDEALTYEPGMEEINDEESSEDDLVTNAPSDHTSAAKRIFKHIRLK